MDPCLNYAIVRQAVGDSSVVIVKCISEDNAADGRTKPLTGKAFTRSQRTLQGLPPLVRKNQAKMEQANFPLTIATTRTQMSSVKKTFNTKGL